MASEHAGPTSIAAYQLLDEIGHGGMGVVHRARDLRLDREVAVKLLLADGPGDAMAVDRFRAEAHITGQLQHPAIPAVHELGALPDGRPFLAMKLVEGRTLQDLLKDRPDPAHDRGRLLAVFEQICQGVGYAHAHGVIHRDLKPANVMVGAFGEVQVMDWGLAKRLSSGGPPKQSTAANEEPAVAVTYIPHDPPANEPAVTGAYSPFDTAGVDGSATRTGSVLGTPAYMPPEQASGEIRKLDARSDVFGLGAILCQVLTGRPPYSGGNANDLRIQAARGEITEALAALDSCGAEPALVTLCMQCLAIRQEDRPADGSAVAQQVAGVRQAAEERARRAELDRVEAQVRESEQRKRRRVQLALAAALVAMLLGGGAFAWWQDRQAAGREAELTARQSRASAAVGANLREARERAAEAWELFDSPDRMQVVTDAALAAVGRAEQFAADGELTGEVAADLETARVEVDDLARHTRLMIEVNRARNDFAVQIVNANLIDQLRAALRQFGFDPLTDAESEVARRVQSSRIRDGLLGILLEMNYHIGWVPTERRGQYERLTIVVRAVRLHLGGSYARWQGLLDRNDVPGLVAFARSPEPLEFRAWVLARVGTDLQAVKEHDAARDLWRAAVAHYPHEAWLRYNLVLTCLNANPPALHEALHHAAAAVTLQPSSPFMEKHLGDVYQKLGDLDRAIVSYRGSIRLNRNWARAHDGLCVALQQKGGLDEALVAAQEFVRIAPKNGSAHTQLGWTHYYRKEYDQAAACYAEVVRLMPHNAKSWNEYGQILWAKRDLDGAIACYRKAIELDPKYARAHTGLGTVLAGKGRVEEAIDCYRRAVALDPKDARAHTNLGRGLYDKGQVDEAIACYRKAIPLYELVHAAQVKTQGADHPDTLWTIYSLATSYQGAGKLPEAIPLYEQTAVGIEKHRFQHTSAGEIILNTARAYEQVKQFEKGEAWRRKWLAVVKEQDGADSPAYARELTPLGWNLLLQKKWTEGETALKESLAICEKKQPDDWRTFNTRSILGGALLGQKKYADAEPLLVAGYEGLKQREKTIPPIWKPNLTQAVARLVQLYEATARPDEAAKLLKQLHGRKGPPKEP